jgi:hypothetical protein
MSAWEYVNHLENEKKTKLAEMAEKQKIIEAEEQHKVNEKKKMDIQDQITECDRLEHAQILEQNSARELISEASKKLSEALQGSKSNLQGAKVAQLMLDTGTVKLNEAAKQLSEITERKQKLLQKCSNSNKLRLLILQQGSECDSTKKTRLGTQAHNASGCGRPCPCEPQAQLAVVAVLFR